jgi:diadenylate cyclase
MQQLLRWQAVADLAVLTVGIYVVLWWARQARALRIVLALLGLHAGSLLADHFEMPITSWVLEAAALIGLVALVLGFQAEVRYAFLRLDSVSRLWSGAVPAKGPSSKAIAEAAFAMAARRIGSLLVIERVDPVAELIRGGVVVGADISAELIEALFQKGSPLHDGAAILEGARISRAAAVLPLTQRTDVPPYFGTRHRAAMGLAERCDALVVVTSEERGEVTLMHGRSIERLAGASQLASALAVEAGAERRIGAALRRALFSDLKLKGAALGFAAAIWSISFLLAGTAIRSVSVPLEFGNVPAGLEVSSQSTDRLEAQLRGNSWVMDSLRMNKLVARFDLSGAAPGRETIRVTPGDFNLPPGVIVDRVVPPSITLSLSRAPEPAAR